MQRIAARKALLPAGWVENVSIEIDENGLIGDVTEHENAVTQPFFDHHVGILLPAPVNVHSHAFQRAMAGLTEKRGPDPSDSFWTWRQLMFRFLNQLTPDHVEAITAFVQMEMLEAGYGASAEFHYLHHQPDGTPYDTLAEMSGRIAAAASKTGISLTLLPVLYQYGGCDKRALSDGQIRFGNDFDRYTRLHEGASAAIQSLPDDCTIGVAPHSLRAVAPQTLKDAISFAGNQPFHLHLAEQVAEVEEIQKAWGKRPVEWLLDHADINDKWCLIHCTQMLPHETAGLAATGAVAGLCPLTESSLGDGIFDGLRWFEENGKIAIGSDSNIRISLSEELRTLDYSQRLRDRSRAALATAHKSTGRRLYDAILAGGAQATGRKNGAIQKGHQADLMTLDDEAVDLIGRDGDTLLDSFIFAGDDRMVRDVWSSGRHLVQDGRHTARPVIVQRYREAISQLGEMI